jgi:hypothetical protein
MEDLAFDEMRRGWDLIKGRCTDTRNNSFQKCSVHRQRFGGHGITFSLSKPHYRPRQRRGGGARYVCGESIIIAVSLNANLCVRDCNSRPYATRKFFDGIHTQGDCAIRSESEILHPRKNVDHFLPVDAVNTARHESAHNKCTATMRTAFVLHPSSEHERFGQAFI